MQRYNDDHAEAVAYIANRPTCEQMSKPLQTYLVHQHRQMTASMKTTTTSQDNNYDGGLLFYNGSSGSDNAVANDGGKYAGPILGTWNLTNIFRKLFLTRGLVTCVTALRSIVNFGQKAIYTIAKIIIAED